MMMCYEFWYSLNQMIKRCLLACLWFAMILIEWPKNGIKTAPFKIIRVFLPLLRFEKGHGLEGEFCVLILLTLKKCLFFPILLWESFLFLKKTLIRRKEFFGQVKNYFGNYSSVQEVQILCCKRKKKQPIPKPLFFSRIKFS